MYESRYFRSYSEFACKIQNPSEVVKKTFEATGESLQDVLAVLITWERLQCILQYTQENVPFVRPKD